MLRLTRGSLLSLLLLGASALTHAEPSVSDVTAAIQAGQLTQAEQMIKGVEPNHPNAPRVHYMLALVLSHMPGREAEASRELDAAVSINPQMPFADATEINALKERIRPHVKASAPLPASVNQPFVPHINRPPESLYDRAMDFVQQNNIAVAVVVGVIAVLLIILSFVGKKKKGGAESMRKSRKEKKSRRREPELPAEEAGQEAESFEYGNRSGEHGGAGDEHQDATPWQSQQNHEEHEDFAR